jgi:hypothetical protein
MLSYRSPVINAMLGAVLALAYVMEMRKDVCVRAIVKNVLVMFRKVE